MCDGYLERYRETIEMQAIAVQVGMINANSKRKHKVFKRKTATGKTGAVTKDEKEEILSDLKSRLVR